MSFTKYSPYFFTQWQYPTCISLSYSPLGWLNQCQLSALPSSHAAGFSCIYLQSLHVASTGSWIFFLLAPSILALTVYQLPVNPNQNSYKGFFRRRRAPSCCPCLPKSASDVTDRKTDWQCATACWCYIWIQRNYTINSCCVYFIRCLPSSRQEMTYLAKANVRQLLVELCKQLEFSLHSQSSPNNSNAPVVSGTGRSAVISCTRNVNSTVEATNIVGRSVGPHSTLQSVINVFAADGNSDNVGLTPCTPFSL